MKIIHFLILSASCALLCCTGRTHDRQKLEVTVQEVSWGPGRAITGPLVISNSWPRCTDLVSWAKDVWRLEGLQEASETRRAIALFNWVRLFNQVCMGGG